MVRVFIENGDRTNRKKARLKYLVDDWGHERFLAATQEKLSFELQYFPLADGAPRVATQQHGHIGVHPSAEADHHYIGVVIPVGRMLPEQMRAVADLAETYGRGDIRLTAWQNLMIPHIASADLEAVKSQIVAMGFHYRASTIAGGLVACTGNAGCKYAASNTKGHAVQLAQFLESELDLDQPLNIHLTGCHHLRSALHRRHRFDCYQGQGGRRKC